MSYKIVRLYKNKYRKYTIARGLTLDEAKAHCSDPETTSKTCTTATGLACTRRNGPWFDSFASE